MGRAAKKRLREQLVDLQDRLSKDTPPFKDSSTPAVKKRYESVKEDADKFGRLYLPHYFDAETPVFHTDIDTILDYPERALFPVHGPREHGKSARGRIKLMHKIFRGDIKYWLFASEQLGLAWDHIDYIFYELVENRRLKSDFEINIIKRDEQKAKLRFRVTNRATGKRHNILLEGVSYGTPVKGKLFISQRPQGCTVDDFESTRSSKNSRIAGEKVDWILQELYGAVTGPIVWFGNIGNQSSALLRIMLRYFDGWKNYKMYAKSGSRPGQFALECHRNNGTHPALSGEDAAQIYPFIFRADWQDEAGTRHYLWPERFPAAWYSNMAATLGYRYSGEMNGMPVKPGKIFQEANLGVWQQLPDSDRLTWYSWLDPAWGRSKHSSYKCWVIAAYDGHYFYIVAAYCRQGAAMADVLDAWYAAWQAWQDAGLRRGGYEETFGQDERLESDIDRAEEKHGWRLPVQPKPNKGEKFARIESMEGTWNSGSILIPEEPGKDINTVIDQCLDFPDGEYLDGPDALEATVTRLRRNRSSDDHTYESLGKRRYKPTRRRR